MLLGEGRKHKVKDLKVFIVFQISSVYYSLIFSKCKMPDKKIKKTAVKYETALRGWRQAVGYSTERE